MTVKELRTLLKTFPEDESVHIGVYDQSLGFLIYPEVKNAHTIFLAEKYLQEIPLVGEACVVLKTYI